MAMFTGSTCRLHQSQIFSAITEETSLLRESTFLNRTTLPQASYPLLRRHQKSDLVRARLFEPAIFEASKLRVQFLGIDEDKHPEQLSRTYTLTHSDITAKLTLAISREINKAQIMGWYSRLQRDEVLAEWKKVKGHMSLHVHCHISGGHCLLDAIAKIRFYIFQKELPVVLEAFRHGDRALFQKHPELDKALVWVYFHSNLKEYNRVECWGPLSNATMGGYDNVTRQEIEVALAEVETSSWHRCSTRCHCCSKRDLIPLPPPLAGSDMTKKGFGHLGLIEHFTLSIYNVNVQ